MNQLNKNSIDQNIHDHLDDIENILGEVLWHALTDDPTIEEVSRQHFKDIEEQVLKYSESSDSSEQFGRGCRFLEVAAYAHVTGYLLAHEKGWQVTLTDISVDTLDVGAKHAKEMGLDASIVHRAAVDFHDLPFETGEFDVVYISAALHHTNRWEKVLRELMRVVTPGGLLILQCEPLKREFCLYNFETNRPGEFRPIEAELDRLEILRTIAQPYYGSRPESLFGMIENQKMPINTIIDIIEERGEIEYLEIDTNICMSSFEKDVLSSGRDKSEVEKYIINELSKRASAAAQLMDDIDHSLGIRMPGHSDIEQLAHHVAPMLAGLPEPDSPGYMAALASIFGGAVTITARIGEHSSQDAEPRYPVYCKSKRKGVDIAFPPSVSEILEITEDLLPDIQDATASMLEKYFPPSEWQVGWIEGSDTKYLSLVGQVGKIVLQTDTLNASYIILMRVWADPSRFPFRVLLYANEEEVAGFDVYQTESFLLKAFISSLKMKPILYLKVSPIGSSGILPDEDFPVTVGAARIITINDVC